MCEEETNQSIGQSVCIYREKRGLLLEAPWTTIRVVNLTPGWGCTHTRVAPRSEKKREKRDTGTQLSMNQEETDNKTEERAKAHQAE